MHKAPFRAHVDLEGNAVSISTPNGGIEYRLHEHHALEDIVRGIRYAIMTSTSVGVVFEQKQTQSVTEEDPSEISRLNSLLTRLREAYEAEKADNKRLQEALEDAADSLQAIATQSGSGLLDTIVNISGYANSRMVVARDALRSLISSDGGEV